ncbi:hypothetical protein CLD20_08170 [Afifella sp. IM 167]|nr:hypothetical protein [Afifella sp. IM 167]
MHFVQSFLRWRRGELERVKAHWRGDPAKGMTGGTKAAEGPCGNEDGKCCSLSDFPYPRAEAPIFGGDFNDCFQRVQEHFSRALAGDMTYSAARDLARYIDAINTLRAVRDSCLCRKRAGGMA